MERFSSLVTKSRPWPVIGRTIFFTSDKNRPARDEIYFIDFWRENLSMYRIMHLSYVEFQELRKKIQKWETEDMSGTKRLRSLEQIFLLPVITRELVYYLYLYVFVWQPVRKIYHLCLGNKCVHVSFNRSPAQLAKDVTNLQKSQVVLLETQSELKSR